MTHLQLSCPSDTDVLAIFEGELARVAKRPDASGIGPALWPRFAGHYQGLSRLPRRVRRTLQRQWRRSLGGLALLLALGQAPALAATINVGGACTLIDSITAANTNGPVGGCTAGGGADTIVLPPNSIHTLTAMNNPTYGSNGIPVITSTITIDGNGSTITRTRDPAAPDFRILAVGSGGDLTLQETTISGGRATGSSFDPQRGGGLLNKGRLSLADSTVSANLALAEGGGVHNGSFVTLRLINSTISGNSASYGGGVSNSQGTVTMTNSTVSGNSASANGGGVNSGGGPLTVTNSTVSGNFARGYGGGFINTGASLTLTTSTVSGNSTSRIGGGVRNNTGTVTLNETLISGNTASSQGPELSNNGGTVNASRYNLFGHDGEAGVTGFTPGATDLVPDAALTAILETALRNNGGPTRTHALFASSPAIDGGGNCAPTTDQRGVARPQGADQNGDGFPDCDIGAFEVAPPPADLSVTKADSPDSVFTGEPLTYTLRVTNNGPASATGVTVTDFLPSGVTFVSAPGSCSGTVTVACVLGSLANGQSATVAIVVTPILAGVLSNTATVAGNQTDLNTGNNSDTETTTVDLGPNANLALTKTDAPDPVTLGANLTYTITVTNRGPNNATGVTVTDSLPGSVTLVSSAPSKGNCSGTVTVTCPLGNLANGDSATVAIVATPTSAGAASNTASVTGNPIDLETGNNSATIATTVLPPPPPPPPPPPATPAPGLQPVSTCQARTCGIRLTCQDTSTSCTGRIDLTVRASALKLGSDPGASAKARRWIPFAAAVVNVPPGRTDPFRLPLTKNGKKISKIFKTKSVKRLKGRLEVRNISSGAIVSNTPITIRLLTKRPR